VERLLQLPEPGHPDQPDFAWQAVQSWSPPEIFSSSIVVSGTLNLTKQNGNKVEVLKVAFTKLLKTLLFGSFTFPAFNDTFHLN
jgi:hypothetical protein